MKTDIVKTMQHRLESVPRVPLPELPTPCVPMERLGAHFGHRGLFVKNDGLSGKEYGGNKIRKLEFLLGEALEQNRKSVITYGAAGSNHALATAVCCRQLGLKAVSVLAPQPTSEKVCRNLLMGHAVGADLHHFSHYNEFQEATRNLTERYVEIDGIAPYIIPAGGTNATGALGFVNAALEMAEQITPDVIYLAMGTGGTLAGLLVGLRMAGLSTRVEAVRVVDPAFRNRTHIRRLCDEICTLLGQPPIVSDPDIAIRNEFLGQDYGIPTAEGREAVRLFEALEGIRLDNTYTGKAAAALIHDLRNGSLNGRSVLFWNTLNAIDFSGRIEDIDFRSLPADFHAYFEGFERY